MSVNFEPVMAALLSTDGASGVLAAAATLTFTADATATSAVLANVSSFAGLFAGLPVFGPGVARGTTIASLDANAETVTLSDAVAETATGATFTTGFLTAGRRLKHWTQVTEQPALFLRRIGTEDDFHGDSERLHLTTLVCEVWIYSQAGADPDAVPDVTLSNLDQMVRTAFAADVHGDFDRCTLGGLVYWARIEGRSDYSPGDQGGQGISRIPVRVTLQPN